jgi:hypothetical protein
MVPDTLSKWPVRDVVMPSGLQVLWASCFLAAALALPLAAQTGPPNPSLTGIWHPVVGSGGACETTGPDGSKVQMEITIVGKEEVNGKTGYWLETAVKGPKFAEVYKDLMISVYEGLAYAKRIMQHPGQEPIEFDGSINAGERMTTPSDVREEAELVGTETISVPAGTFTCEHYRLKGGWGDAWVSDNVSPRGLVKMLFASQQGVPEYYTDGRPPKNVGPTRGKDSSTVLTKIITDTKDHITGTPTKIEPIK